MNILIWIVTGIVAGWLAGLILKGKGFGLLGNFAVGIVGGVIGGWLGRLIGISASSWIGNVLIAAAGGIILVLIVRTIFKK